MDAEKSPETAADDKPKAEPVQAPSDLGLSSAQILERLHLIDRQVADLQMDSVQAKKPWHRDASVVISIVVFLFSLATTFFSQRQLDEQRRQSARAELRGLIQRISELPRMNIEYSREFTDAVALANLNGLLQAENAMIARQAAEIMDRLPGDVSASELSLVALAMTNSNLGDDAIVLFDKAIRTAKNANDKVAALRGKAALLISSGDVAGGREVFKQALDVFREYPTKNGYYEHLTHIDTHLFWAGSEHSRGECEQASTHIAAARQHAGELVPGPVTSQKLQQIEAVVPFLNTCMPIFPQGARAAVMDRGGQPAP